MSETCFACGGTFDPDPGGATHAYMLSSPGCWSAYGKVLQREYSDPQLFGAAHRLTVDAFALQHPGEASDRRALQSFWLHGAALWIVLRHGQSHSRGTAALKALAGGAYCERPAAPRTFAFTHADLLAAPEEDHVRLAQEWAEAALAGWEAAHPEFEALAYRAFA